MMRRAWLAAVLAPIAAVWLAGARPAARSTLPARLTDREFWKLSLDWSEPNGYFRSDNLTSNELLFERVIDDLLSRTRPGGAYLGVGPEQNFTYMAATRPAIAIIFDIRRGNLQLQLMYKALFELSTDRADFVSRLFARARPEGLTAKSTADEIFSAFRNVETNESAYAENLKAIDALLTVKHAFNLSPEDLKGIEYVYHTFNMFGPRIQYSSSGSFGGPFQPSYADLMSQTDGKGQARGFLANDENFRVLKDLESKNLIVPAVGNFGGPKAIRALGDYLKRKGATVSAFYLSNVEQYLRMDGIWRNFCQNVAALPLDETSVFIRAVRRIDGQMLGLSSELGDMMNEVKDCR